MQSTESDHAYIYSHYRRVHTATRLDMRRAATRRQYTTSHTLFLPRIEVSPLLPIAGTLATSETRTRSRKSMPNQGTDIRLTISEPHGARWLWSAHLEVRSWDFRMETCIYSILLLFCVHEPRECSPSAKRPSAKRRALTLLKCTRLSSKSSRQLLDRA